MKFKGREVRARPHHVGMKAPTIFSSTFDNFTHWRSIQACAIQARSFGVADQMGRRVV